MKVYFLLPVIASFVTAGLVSSCSSKKSFAGGTTSGTANAAAEEPSAEGAAPPIEDEDDNTGDFKNCDTSASSNFSAELYKLPESTERLPKFETLTKVKDVCLDQVNIAERDFTEGFPGIDKSFIEYFALNINVKIAIAKAGTYKFRVNSDDGSKLFIDGKLVVDNDDKHGVRSRDGEIELTAGSHALNLQYFQGPKYKIALELFWTPPGSSESLIPTKIITRSGQSEL